MTAHLDACTRSLYHLQAAHQVLTYSYPMLKEEKLLLVALNHLFLSFQSSIQALSGATSIPQMKKALKEYPLALEAFQQIEELIRLHKQSPVEFARNENLVIATENYDLSILTQERLHEFLLIAEQFQNSVDRKILSENL